MKANFVPACTLATLMLLLVGAVLRVESDTEQSTAAPTADSPIESDILRIVAIEAPVPQQAITGVVTFAPGSSAGHHLHHGIEGGYVLSGEVEVVSDGEPSQIYHSGETFVTYRDHPHALRNPGTAVARAVVTWIVDANKPLTAPVP